MSVKSVFISILTILTLATRAQKPVNTDLHPYEFNTTLKGGYRIFFASDDSFQYLYLKKGKRTIAELSSMSKGLPYKNLGYIAADYTDYFMLGHSYGGGNPRYIELVKKSTGQNRLLALGAAMIDVDEKQQYFLYSDNHVPGKKDKMTLLNIRTMKKEKFYFPNDMLDEPEVLNRIRIGRLTDQRLTIKYRTENGEKAKIFRR